MNNNEVKGHGKESKVKEVAGKVTSDKSTEYKGNAEKQRRKGGAVLGEINSDPKNASKSTK